MANLTLLAQIVADEALEAELATEAAYEHLRAALADGEFTPEEAVKAVQMLENALREAREAQALSDYTYKRYRFAETLLREDVEDVKAGRPEWKRHRKDIAREAGFREIHSVPDNVIPLRITSDDAPAVG